ncbi:MAG: SDR family NAD(P)-dependent oxidoreductase [Ktedonobacteraceae bacterium]|nr:SDR family NAD(P)-dependent oxidoreductase [Ktedonobacteraceae bacterium]
MKRKTIVITGCSSGFGRITSLTLAKQNWLVFATVRQDADREQLLSAARELSCENNLRVLLCDITNAEQVTAMARQVEELLSVENAEAATPHSSGLNALLNNAGTAFGGPIELLSIADLRAQLELNVIAQVAVTQALLPLLKAAQGTLINVSSVGGRIATPMVGAYSASKYALEAISDALRIELAPFDVHVVLIEPTASPTNIWQTSLDRALPDMESHRTGPYARLLTVIEKVARRSSRSGFPSQLFADTVVKILASPKPHARYVVPRSAVLQIALKQLLPDSLWDYLVRRTLKW